MTTEHILIVDDNPINLKLARVLLAAAGYTVTMATSAEEALAILARDRPDLILMDIQLPEMDGLELTRRIKANPDLATIVIVALTAFAMKGDEEKARVAGCEGYIAKPINTRTFVAEIADYLATAKSGNHTAGRQA